MRHPKYILGAVAVSTLLPSVALAQNFGQLDQAQLSYSQAETRPDLIVELGLGAGAVPAYEGASTYTGTIIPLINLERLNIPGVIDIGGAGATDGLKIAPSISVVRERKSVDFAPLAGLNNVDTTYALGGRIGYEIGLNEAVSVQPYVAARYAFGGAQGFVGEVGLDMTARLTPELTLVAGPVVNFASENYMDRYYGVSAAESASTGGRLAAFDPQGGIRSVGVKAAVKYEFVADTFLNLEGSYSRIVGGAENSPIVQSGSDSAFTAGVGISRRFSFNY
ncbi:MipA/OmpV family protein [Devosia sp. MC532]|uniref:MipA/OmpV family protein n=1 Tax=Devosia sp. MC532 TaxID=2799788 RepID=UPI0018F4E1B8|nr:MipA/OmpV family protein [Devosia sp. MC532]MBJ7578371.1 MipA/OmpV family protein [Devosia sp. MC532]